MRAQDLFGIENGNLTASRCPVHTDCMPHLGDAGDLRVAATCFDAVCSRMPRSALRTFKLHIEQRAGDPHRAESRSWPCCPAWSSCVQASAHGTRVSGGNADVSKLTKPWLALAGSSCSWSESSLSLSKSSSPSSCGSLHQQGASRCCCARPGVSDAPAGSLCFL